MNTFLDEFLQLLDKSQKILLSLHKNPDGDSLGSNIALALALGELGKDVAIMTPDPVPSYLEFANVATQMQIKPSQEIDFGEFDLFIALDMSAPDMLKLETPLPDSIPTICIDHHKTNMMWCNINYVEPEAISTASVLTRLIPLMGVSLSKPIADALLLGLATDSGFFRYNRDADSFRVAAELIEAGADYQTIVYEINQQTTLSDYQFVGFALSQLVVERGVAIISVGHDLWQKYCAKDDRTHMLKSYIQNIKGTKAGIILTEEEPGVVKVSLRAREKDVDVAEIAKALGGGGHKAAAGATIFGKSLEEAKEIVVKLLDVKT